MKWSLESKFAIRGVVLTLLLLGTIRFLLEQHTHQLVENRQVERSEVIVRSLREICSSVADGEAGRLNYLFLGNKAEFERHKQALKNLKQYHKILQDQLGYQQKYNSDLKKLESLISQRIALANRSIDLYQEDPSRISSQRDLNKSLNQNRAEIHPLIGRIQAQEEQALILKASQFAASTRFHRDLEFLGVVLMSILLLGLYTMLYWQTVKRQEVEATEKRLSHEKELSDLKLNFFSMVSHELRTPLSIILGSAQLLMEDINYSEDKKRKNLNRIQITARSMNQLLSNILTLSRAEAGKLEFHPTRVDLEDFCLNLIENIQVTSEPSRKIYFDNQGPCMHAQLDEKLQNFILTNLLSNALKYSSPDSPVYLTLQSDPETIIFQVRDQGIGILPNDQEALYQPFYRGKNSVKAGGTGLGLAVVKKCIDLHQGTIKIDSEVGVGTTVTVRIPTHIDLK